MFILIKAEAFTADVFLMRGDDGIEAMDSSVSRVDVMCSSTCRPGVLARALWVRYLCHTIVGLQWSRAILNVSIWKLIVDSGYRAAGAVSAVNGRQEGLGKSAEWRLQRKVW